MKRPKEANKFNDLKRPEKANKVNDVKLPEDVNEKDRIRGNECPDTIKRVVPPVVIDEKKTKKKKEWKPALGSSNDKIRAGKSQHLDTVFKSDASKNQS